MSKSRLCLCYSPLHRCANEWSVKIASLCGVGRIAHDRTKEISATVLRRKHYDPGNAVWVDPIQPATWSSRNCIFDVLKQRLSATVHVSY